MQKKVKDKSNRLIRVILILTGLICSCKSEDPVPVNEEELITTLIYELTPAEGGEIVTYKFTDLDGDGGNPPLIESGKLKPFKEYTCKIILLDETKNPPLIISSEVAEEADEHQFFYGINAANLNILYADKDNNGNPVGLITNATTESASAGTLTISLRHEPDKTASGVSDGDITNAGGETDIEVTFDIIIE